jgi:hypothetical protein
LLNYVQSLIFISTKLACRRIPTILILLFLLSLQDKYQYSTKKGPDRLLSYYYFPVFITFDSLTLRSPNYIPSAICWHY